MTHRIGLVGARGYTGSELIRLLAAHPRFELAFVTSRELDGQRVADHNPGFSGDLRYGSPAYEELPGLGADAVVLALPNGKAANISRARNKDLESVAVALAKAVAGRDKDREFCMALFEHGYVTPAQVLELVPLMPVDDKEQRTLRATIRRWAKAVRDAGHNVPEA